MNITYHFLLCFSLGSIVTNGLAMNVRPITQDPASVQLLRAIECHDKQQLEQAMASIDTLNKVMWESLVPPTVQETPLTYAIKINPDPEFIELLITRYGADPNYTLPDGNSPLHIAWKEGVQNPAQTIPQIIIVQTLCRLGAHIEYQNPALQVVPILHEMVAQNRLDWVKLLVNSRPDLDLNIVNAMGDTPLSCATHKNYFDIAEYLLEHDASTSRAPLKPAILFEAIQKGKKRLARLLVQKGMDPNSPTALGDAPLWIAIAQKDIALVKYLLEKGANIHAKAGKATCLHAAAAQGNLEIFKTISEYCPDITSSSSPKGPRGWTVVHLAAANPDPEILKELLQNMLCNPEQRDSVGHTPLSAAIINKHPNNVEILLKHGANPHHVVSLSPPQSMVSIAIIRHCDVRILQMLLESGKHPALSDPTHIEQAFQQAYAHIHNDPIAQRNCDNNLFLMNLYPIGSSLAHVIQAHTSVQQCISRQQAVLEIIKNVGLNPSALDPRQLEYALLFPLSFPDGTPTQITPLALLEMFLAHGYGSPGEIQHFTNLRYAYAKHLSEQNYPLLLALTEAETHACKIDDTPVLLGEVLPLEILIKILLQNSLASRSQHIYRDVTQGLTEKFTSQLEVARAALSRRQWIETAQNIQNVATRAQRKALIQSTMENSPQAPSTSEEPSHKLRILLSLSTQQKRLNLETRQ